MTEIDLHIDIRWGDDWELKDFLIGQGVRCRPDYGVFNGPMPDPSQIGEMLKRPAPYLIVTAAGHLLISALSAYAKVKKKRIVIQRLKSGALKVDATNWTPKDLKELGVMDYLRFDPADKKADDD
jgi:hypothetical protein